MKLWKLWQAAPTVGAELNLACIRDEKLYRITRKWTQLKHRTRNQDEQYTQRSGDESRD